MKRIFTLAMFLLPLLAAAQEARPFQKSGVESVSDSASKEELFLRARAWFNKTFVSGKSVLQTADKESGELVGNGTLAFKSRNFFMESATVGYINYTVSVTVKDGRYKYVIGRFMHEGEKISIGLLTSENEFPYKVPFGGSRQAYNKVWNELKDESAALAHMLYKSLYAAMNVKSEKDKDW